MYNFFRSILPLVILSSAACSTDRQDFRIGKLIAADDALDVKETFTEMSGTVSAKLGKARWVKCTKDLDLPLVYFFPSKTLKQAGSCLSPQVQAALFHNHNVLIVDELTVGKPFGSNGDIGGEKSMSLVKALHSSHGTPAGIWSEGLASVLAMRFARLNQVNWVIVGDGIYDFEAEESLNKDKEFLTSLAQLKATSPGSYQELRSIAWDFEGFPKLVYLYDLDTASTMRQKLAKDFVDGLSAAGHVAAFKLLAVESGDLSHKRHGVAIGAALKGFHGEH